MFLQILLSGRLRLFIFLFFVFNHVSAQQNGENCNFIIKGQVIDEHNNEVLPYATIVLKETNIAAVSDSLGYFVLPPICAGKYTLISTHVGCEDVVISLTISDNLTIVIKQEHHTKELHELTIVANKLADKTSASISTLKSRDFEQSKGKPLAEALKSIAGVSSLQTGASISKPVIHGLHSNRVLIMNNGVRQEGQQWGSEHGPEIDPFIAGKISVIKGAASVRYGPDAIGGVILIDPLPLRDTVGVGREVNVGGASNGKQGTVSAILNGNHKILPGFSWRLQGTLKQAGNIKAPNYYLKNTGYNERNYSAAAGYKKKYFGTEVFFSRFDSKVGIFSAAHIGNLTDLQKAFESNVPLEQSGFSYQINRPYQLITHDLLKSKTWLDLGRYGKLTYTAARQSDWRREYDKHVPRNDSLAALNQPELSFKINTLTHELLYELQLANYFKTTIGFNSMHQANSYEGRYFIPNFNNKGMGLFLIETYKKNRWLLEAGLRADTRRFRVFLTNDKFFEQPLYQFKNIAAMGGISYITNLIDFKLNMGTGWRPPGVNELYANGVHHGAAAVEIGDKNLQKESNVNVSFLMDLIGFKKLSGSIEVYNNRINNFIYLIPVQPATLTIRGAFPTFKYVQLNANLLGNDVTLNYQCSKLVGLNFKSTTLIATQLETGDRLTQMPQNTQELGLTIEPNLTGKWHHLYFKISGLNILKAPHVSSDQDYLAPPNGYQLLTIDAGIALNIKKQNVLFSFVLNNALNRSYRSYLNRYRYFADDAGINASLNIKIPFNF